MPDRSLLRQLPQVEEVAKAPAIARLEGRLPHGILVDAVRDEISHLRAAILEGETPEISVEGVAGRAAASALALTRPSLRRAFRHTVCCVGKRDSSHA